ncbi:MAG: phosphotransferase, partial [Planctomycetales bacterium]|nr:phosphotransferase [Planctomycetales bacterium]
ALRQFELAMVPFRRREHNWGHLMEERLQRSSELLRSVVQRTSSRPKPAAPTDESLPWLAEACDPSEAGWRLAEIGCGMKIRAARLLRHKPGRRAVIEYCLGGENAGDAVRLVGKTEYKSRQRKRMATQRLLWDAGFDSAAPDGISVTRPLGEVPEWNMWLQEHAEGENGWDALRGPYAINAARLAARALAKLHRSRITAPKQHNYMDEQAILNDRLTTASHMAPDLSPRIDRLRDHCSRLLNSVKEPPDALLHRDFYPDQMLFHRDRVTLLDLDLICRGPASIDVGNFLGHLAEMGIRRSSDPNYFAEVERAFLETYLKERPSVELRSIAISKLATLARHAYISQMHVGRRAFTSEILFHCELLLAN